MIYSYHIISYYISPRCPSIPSVFPCFSGVWSHKTHLFPLIWNHIFLSFIGYKFIISDHISPYYPYICHIMPWYFMHFHGSQKVSPYVFVMFSFSSWPSSSASLWSWSLCWSAPRWWPSGWPHRPGKRAPWRKRRPGMTRDDQGMAMGPPGGPWISWVIPSGYD